MKGWKRGHLLIDDSGVFVELERNDLIIMAQKTCDAEVADLILSDIHVVDAVDDIILKMMAA